MQCAGQERNNAFNNIVQYDDEIRYRRHRLKVIYEVFKISFSK